jgi:hypothetical protein
MDLSREYFYNQAKPALEAAFPDLFPRMAFGLVGNGSECFGFDDAISRDHDWGVDFCIWLLDADASANIDDINEWKNKFFREHPPLYTKQLSRYTRPTGAQTVSGFYKQLIGCGGVPKTLREWIRIPEENLAIATNGEAWLDPCGDFSAIRHGLLGFYPEDLRRKRIAARCMEAAQSGQYNFQRMARRGDRVACTISLARFTEAVIALVFLLSKVYRPFYKWSFKRMLELPGLGAQVGDALSELTGIEGFDQSAIDKRSRLIDGICDMLVKRLNQDGLASSTDCFMTAQGLEVQAGIEDPALRNLPAQYLI